MTPLWTNTCRLIVALLTLNKLDANSPSCNENQVTQCREAARNRDLDNLEAGGRCMRSEYVTYTHLCSVHDFRPDTGVDYCCCVFQRRTMCCGYLQHVDRFRCSDPADSIDIVDWGPEDEYGDFFVGNHTNQVTVTSWHMWLLVSLGVIVTLCLILIVVFFTRRRLRRKNTTNKGTTCFSHCYAEDSENKEDACSDAAIREENCPLRSETTPELTSHSDDKFIVPQRTPLPPSAPPADQDESKTVPVSTPPLQPTCPKHRYSEDRDFQSSFPFSQFPRQSSNSSTHPCNPPAYHTQTSDSSSVFYSVDANIEHPDLQTRLQQCPSCSSSVFLGPAPPAYDESIHHRLC